MIINLNTDRSLAAFKKLSSYPFDELYSNAGQTELFNLFDKGLIEEFDFFVRLKQEMRYTGEEIDLLQAWNAMLLDVPVIRLKALLKAKQRYRTFLLSNTCEPHIAVFEKDLYHQHGVKNFDDYFDKVYYSCRVHMRKPEPEIFELVLKENNLKPEETVFIDDSIHHVKAAGKCGINSYLLPKGMELGDLLKELKLL